MNGFSSSFTIPKKRKVVVKEPVKEEELVPDKLTFRQPTPEETKELEDIVLSSIYEKSIKIHVEISDIKLISNPKLQRKFQTFKSSLRSKGHSDRVSYCFYQIGLDNEEELQYTCENGFATDMSYYGDLGQASQGVYLFRHVDMVTSAPMVKGLPMKVMCFMTLQGKSQEVGLDSLDLEPTINYNSHIPVPVNEHANRYSKHVNSAIYFYEFDESYEITEFPSGVLPYAIFDIAPKTTFRPNLKFSSMLNAPIIPNTVFNGKWNFGAYLEPFTLESIVDTDILCPPRSIHYMGIRGVTPLKTIAQHPIMKQLFRPKYWGQLMSMVEVPMLQEDDVTVSKSNRLFAAHFVYKTSDPTFRKRIDALRTEHLGLVGVDIRDTLVFLFPSGEFAARLGLPWLSEPHLHTVFVQPTSIMGIHGLNEMNPFVEKNLCSTVDMNYIVDGTNPAIINAVNINLNLKRQMWGEQQQRGLLPTPPDLPPRPSGPPVPSMPRGSYSPSPIMDMDTPSDNPREDGNFSPEQIVDKPQVVLLPPPSKGILMQRDQERLNGPPQSRFGSIGRPTGPKKRVKWTDSIGKPLSNFSRFDKNEASHRISVSALHKKDLETEKLQFKNYKMTQEDKANNDIFKGAFSSLSSHSFTAPDEPQTSTSDDKLRNIMSDPKPLQNTKLITRINIPISTVSSSSNEVVERPYSPTLPMRDMTPPPATLQDDDMDIEDSQEEDTIEEEIPADFVDPHDIDYDSHFAGVVPLEDTKPEMDNIDEDTASGLRTLVQEEQKPGTTEEVEALLSSIFNCKKKSTETTDPNLSQVPTGVPPPVIPTTSSTANNLPETNTNFVLSDNLRKLLSGLPPQVDNFSPPDASPSGNRKERRSRFDQQPAADIDMRSVVVPPPKLVFSVKSNQEKEIPKSLASSVFKTDDEETPVKESEKRNKNSSPKDRDDRHHHQSRHSSSHKSRDRSRSRDRERDSKDSRHSTDIDDRRRDDRYRDKDRRRSSSGRRSRFDEKPKIDKDDRLPMPSVVVPTCNDIPLPPTKKAQDRLQSMLLQKRREESTTVSSSQDTKPQVNHNIIPSVFGALGVNHPDVQKLFSVPIQQSMESPMSPPMTDSDDMRPSQSIPIEVKHETSDLPPPASPDYPASPEPEDNPSVDNVVMKMIPSGEDVIESPASPPPEPVTPVKISLVDRWAEALEKKKERHSQVEEEEDGEILSDSEANPPSIPPKPPCREIPTECAEIPPAASPSPPLPQHFMVPPPTIGLTGPPTLRQPPVQPPPSLMRPPPPAVRSSGTFFNTGVSYFNNRVPVNPRLPAMPSYNAAPPPIHSRSFVVVPDFVTFSPVILDPKRLEDFFDKMKNYTINKVPCSFVPHVHLLKHVAAQSVNPSLPTSTKCTFKAYQALLTKNESLGTVRPMVEHDCDKARKSTEDTLRCLSAIYNQQRRMNPMTCVIYMSNVSPSSPLGQQLIKMGVRVCSVDNLLTNFPQAFM